VCLCRRRCDEDNVCRFDGDLEAGEVTPVLKVVTGTEPGQAGLVIANGVTLIEDPSSDTPVAEVKDHSSTVLRVSNTKLAFAGASSLLMFFAGLGLAGAGLVLVIGGRVARRSAEPVI